MLTNTRSLHNQNNLSGSVAPADASAWGEAVYTARVMLGMFDLDGNIGAGNQRRVLHEEVIADVTIGTAYPFPTKGSFSFAADTKTGLEKAMVKMYDLQGRLVRSFMEVEPDGNAIKLDLNGLNAGAYLIKWQTKGFNQVEKLWINP